MKFWNNYIQKYFRIKTNLIAIFRGKHEFAEKLADFVLFIYILLPQTDNVSQVDENKDNQCLCFTDLCGCCIISSLKYILQQRNQHP